MNPDPPGHEPETDPMLDAFAEDLLRSGKPPTTPPGLKSRALAQARRELARHPASGQEPMQRPALERWIGSLFGSRLFWTTWAAAMVLAMALRPPAPDPAFALPEAEPARAELRLDGTELEAPEAWIASASHRPHPTGPLLTETPSFPIADLN